MLIRSILHFHAPQLGAILHQHPALLRPDQVAALGLPNVENQRVSAPSRFGYKVVTVKSRVVQSLAAQLISQRQFAPSDFETM